MRKSSKVALLVQVVKVVEATVVIRAIVVREDGPRDAKHSKCRVSEGVYRHKRLAGGRVQWELLLLSRLLLRDGQG